MMMTRLPVAETGYVPFVANDSHSWAAVPHSWAARMWLLALLSTMALLALLLAAAAVVTGSQPSNTTSARAPARADPYRLGERFVQPQPGGAVWCRFCTAHFPQQSAKGRRTKQIEHVALLCKGVQTILMR